MAGFYKNTSIDKAFGDLGITIYGSGIGETYKSWGGNSVFVTHDVVYFIMDGTSGKITYNGETTIIKPGHAYFLPQGITVDLGAPDGLRKIYFHLNFFTSDGTDFFDDFKRIGELECHEVIESIAEKYMATDYLSLMVVKNNVIGTVLKIAEKYGYSKLSPKLSELTKAVIKQIDENLSATLTCEDIAKRLCVSKMTVWRHFKSEMGISVKAYITRRLMTKAVNLLMTSDAKINEISTSLGFYDQFYFSRVFKQEMGVSPTKMRSQNIIKTL